MRYRGTGRTGYQTVHPYGFLYGSRHYLVAFSEIERARDIRLFVLANISAVTVLDEGFTPPEGFSLRTFTRRSFGVFQERPADVVWRFSPRAAADARRFVFHPDQRLTEEPDGSLLVAFTAGGLQEMCWHLFTWGREVEIVKPARLRRLMARLLAEAAAAGEATAAGDGAVPAGEGDS